MADNILPSMPSEGAVIYEEAVLCSLLYDIRLKNKFKYFGQKSFVQRQTIAKLGQTNGRSRIRVKMYQFPEPLSVLPDPRSNKGARGSGYQISMFFSFNELVTRR